MKKEIKDYSEFEFFNRKQAEFEEYEKKIKKMKQGTFTRKEKKEILELLRKRPEGARTLKEVL